MTYQNTICRGIDVGFSDPAFIYDRTDRSRPACPRGAVVVPGESWNTTRNFRSLRSNVQDSFSFTGTRMQFPNLPDICLGFRSACDQSMLKQFFLQ